MAGSWGNAATQGATMALGQIQANKAGALNMYSQIAQQNQERVTASNSLNAIQSNIADLDNNLILQHTEIENNQRNAEAQVLVTAAQFGGEGRSVTQTVKQTETEEVLAKSAADKAYENNLEAAVDQAWSQSYTLSMASQPAYEADSLGNLLDTLTIF